MIELARGAGRPVLVDPKGDDYTRYRGASVVTPNRAELREVVGTWTDEADLARRVEGLRAALDFGALLVTRSEHGMSLFRKEGAVHVPAQTREVYDVSGAGDTVIAALGVMIAAGVGLEDAMHIANRAAGIVVGKLGTAVATREELFG
jgi:rfaE bifunctional protein kinase chain/domain